MVDVAAEMAKLRAEYLAALPPRLEELRALLDAVRAAPGAAAALTAARRMTHRLRGSAGTFGLGELGAAIAIIDDTLGAAAAPGAPPVDWAVVDAALARALVPDA
jgi:chemotaxis protein histidine kinase CheA